MPSHDDPNAPQVGHDFKRVQPDRELPADQKRKVDQGKMATRAELDMLTNQEQTPELECNLDIGGNTEIEVKTALEEERLKRIEEIRNLLNSRGQEMDESFNRSR